MLLGTMILAGGRYVPVARLGVATAAAVDVDAGLAAVEMLVGRATAVAVGGRRRFEPEPVLRIGAPAADARAPFAAAAVAVDDARTPRAVVAAADDDVVAGRATPLLERFSGDGRDGLLPDAVWESARSWLSRRGSGAGRPTAVWLSRRVIGDGRDGLPAVRPPGWLSRRGSDEVRVGLPALLLLDWLSRRVRYDGRDDGLGLPARPLVWLSRRVIGIGRVAGAGAGAIDEVDGLRVSSLVDPAAPAPPLRRATAAATVPLLLPTGTPAVAVGGDDLPLGALAVAAARPRSRLAVRGSVTDTRAAVVRLGPDAAAAVDGRPPAAVEEAVTVADGRRVTAADAVAVAEPAAGPLPAPAGAAAVVALMAP